MKVRNAHSFQNNGIGMLADTNAILTTLGMYGVVIVILSIL